MPKGVYERKPRESHMAPESPQQTNKQMFPVILSKNYAPRGEYEIVGYLKAEVKQKDAAGQWRVIEKEAFIKGEMKPHESPGVGYPGKIWAGTHIMLPIEEAKALISRKAAERADAIAA